MQAGTLQAQQVRGAATLAVQDACSPSSAEVTRVHMPGADAHEAPCSTSSLCCDRLPAFLERRNVCTRSGLLMLKSLTYAELERWCIHIGARAALAPMLAFSDWVGCDLCCLVMGVSCMRAFATSLSCMSVLVKTRYTVNYELDKCTEVHSKTSFYCIYAGERPQRARQLWRWMYYRGNWVRSLEETAGLQDGISEAFRWAKTLQHSGLRFIKAAHQKVQEHAPHHAEDREHGSGVLT